MGCGSGEALDPANDTTAFDRGTQSADPALLPPSLMLSWPPGILATAAYSPTPSMLEKMLFWIKFELNIKIINYK